MSEKQFFKLFLEYFQKATERVTRKILKAEKYGKIGSPSITLQKK